MPSPAEVAAALAYADALVRDGQAHSPFGAALLTLAAAVRGLTDQRDSYKAAYDELNVRLAGVEAERDHFRDALARTCETCRFMRDDAHVGEPCCTISLTWIPCRALGNRCGAWAARTETS